MVYYPPKVLKKVPAMMPQSDISISIHAVDDARYEKPVAAFLLSRGKPEVITHKRFPEGALGEREADTADVIAALMQRELPVREGGGESRSPRHARLRNANVENGTHGIPNTVSRCLGNEIQAKNPVQGSG